MPTVSKDKSNSAKARAYAKSQEGKKPSTVVLCGALSTLRGVLVKGEPVYETDFHTSACYKAAKEGGRVGKLPTKVEEAADTGNVSPTEGV